MRFRAEVLTDVFVSLKIVGCDCEFEESFLTWVMGRHWKKRKNTMRTLCWNWRLPWSGDFLKVPQVKRTSMLKNCGQRIVTSL